MSYPHAETGGVKGGFTMARNRDYDDGDFDQPKRSPIRIWTATNMTTITSTTMKLS